MLALAYDAGLHREELCLLATGDIDPAHRLLTVRAETTKSRKGRVVPYSEAAGGLLSAYLLHRKTLIKARGPLFISESRRNVGVPLTFWTWSKVVHSLAKRAGLPQLSTHTFRHLCLTDLARAGWELHEIANFAGHRNTSTTMIYIHLSDREDCEGVAPHGTDGRSSGGSPMIDVAGYDHTHALSPDELHHMQILVTRFQEGGKGWHKAARPALQRLLGPLETVLDHLGAVNTIKRKNTIRTTVICLLIRAMVRHEQTFWAFSTDIWFELLGTDYYAYVRVHGVTANARQQLIAVAYLFCGFQELGCLGRLAFPALARKVFGTEAFDAVIDGMTADLITWGYSRNGNIMGLRCALAEAMLASRSLQLSDLQASTLERLYREADAKITRRGLTILSYVLVRRGFLQTPLGRDGQIERKESILHRRALSGVPVVWRKWCERWFATTTLQPSSRMGVIYRLFNAGRWLAQTGYGPEPSDWNRKVAAAYVAAIGRATIGQWSTRAVSPASQTGQPLKPASKGSALTAVRQFFRDCQEWG